MLASSFMWSSNPLIMDRDTNLTYMAAIKYFL